ncbi:MAG TPA: O-antigen ligase family protein [Beijerinckiaceae bacterium]|jgi:O-antigen ligase
MTQGSIPSVPSRRLWALAAAGLALMPVGMAVASRSSPIFVVLAALAALSALAVEGRAGSVASDLRRAFAMPLGLVAAIFVAWCAVTIAWSAAPRVSLHQFGEALLPLAAALVLGLTLPGRVRRWLAWGLAGAIVTAAALIAAELATGLALRRELGTRASTFIFNRSALTLLVLLPAACALAWASLPRRRAQIVTLVLVAATALTVLRSDSGAAILGLALGLAAYVMARVLPRVATALAVLGIVAAFATAPFLGEIVDRVVPAKAHESLAETHSRDRVEIWQSFGLAVRAAPLVGQGFGVSARFATTPVAAALPVDNQILLAVGHPHNAVLQIWAELGLVGAGLAAALLILLVRYLAALPPARYAPRLALLAGALAVALVGHGAWQGWWWACLGTAAVLFRVADRIEDGVSS